MGKTLSIALDRDLDAALTRRAKLEGRTKADVVRAILRSRLHGGEHISPPGLSP